MTEKLGEVNYRRGQLKETDLNAIIQEEWNEFCDNTINVEYFKRHGIDMPTLAAFAEEVDIVVQPQKEGFSTAAILISICIYKSKAIKKLATAIDLGVANAIDSPAVSETTTKLIDISLKWIQDVCIPRIRANHGKDSINDK